MMKHILDNPIYNALKTGNTLLAEDHGQVSIFQRDVAPFAGMENNSAADFEALGKYGGGVNPIVIFAPEKLNIPTKWEILRDFKMLQMVYEGPLPAVVDSPYIIDLNKTHVSEMLALTQLTKPGPFLERTIEFGGYTGIMENGKLVSMAGQRMQPTPYVEISAVCTHPNSLGKGYAGVLLNEQIRRIMQAHAIPFLHVLADNHPAISVYQRIGFKTRRTILGYAFNIM